MGNWQLIETASKTSDVVLLYADGEVSVGYFDDGTDEDGEFFQDPSWWWFDQEATGEFEPTHWMPLPAPPSS